MWRCGRAPARHGGRNGSAGGQTLPRTRIQARVPKGRAGTRSHTQSRSNAEARAHTSGRAAPAGSRSDTNHRPTRHRPGGACAHQIGSNASPHPESPPPQNRVLSAECHCPEVAEGWSARGNPPRLWTGRRARRGDGSRSREARARTHTRKCRHRPPVHQLSHLLLQASEEASRSGVWKTHRHPRPTSHRRTRGGKGGQQERAVRNAPPPQAHLRTH